MIHYIQPYSTAKNIGGAINLAIESLVTSESDWIVLLDHDVMFLRPDSKFQLEEILSNTKFDILGPLTNRLGRDTQLGYDSFEVSDIKVHLEIASIAHDTCYGATHQTRENLAAMVLCFRVSTWRRLGRFMENTLNFDTVFCQMAKNAKFTLAVMPGIYVFHLYRMGSLKGHTDYSHLINKTPEN